MPEPYQNLAVTRHGPVFVITLQKPPENRINRAFAQELIRAFRNIEVELGGVGSGNEGCVVVRGSDHKFFCTGLELDETDRNPYANTDGFYPLLRTVLDFPYPTIALLTGHTFGGACPFAFSHDYRIMNKRRGFLSMPPVDLGLHFHGIGALPRLKFGGRVARKMLLEAHRWTGEEALKDGIVDAVAEPDEMLEAALELGRKIAPKAKMGVYATLREELWGEALKKFGRISYVHGRETSRPAKAKI
ncbi:ClpP/crotonase [Viridothelium virens]|uniref:ClpP/crotonase n=1 Tax=Viridothelium virens TaxID=1048519 RepID=A0A6A6GVA5_VIRVR|nr:ClpP/crotonase [Viridothelium virens]